MTREQAQADLKKHGDAVVEVMAAIKRLEPLAARVDPERHADACVKIVTLVARVAQAHPQVTVESQIQMEAIR